LCHLALGLKVRLETMSLKATWLAKLGKRDHALLAESLDEFPELQEAIAPPRYGFQIEDESELSYLARVAEDEVFVHLRALLVPPGEDPTSDSERVGLIDVDLDSREKLMILDTLNLPQHLQGEKRGSLVVAQLAALGDELDLEAIELQAGNVGRWAWLRCGFDFLDDDNRGRLVEPAKAFAQRLGVEVDLDQIRHSWDFIDLEGKAMPEQIQAAGGPRIAPEDQPVSIGKALVLGPPLTANLWFGRLELDRESSGRVRLDTYVFGDGDT
jgi:hypothetical protein